MSHETNQPQDKPALNNPFLLGYSVRPTGEGNKSYWSKIAVAWAHKDGQGFNVQMDAMPVDGKLVLRTVPEDHDGTGEVIEPSPE
ncbi:hypothetical protein TRP8649_02336 [Pelagimonas phthalicica]|uniref:DUF736 domain-containing protein n=1 Tax=Pelagimonas phthalicica TaxID=1037362 RepID=A0A238JBY5_9RHOB|nr:hypothetical protein [Pelagimonas phthalicica]TDS91174.1 hypothetical protein CLV87_2338 [Pelagimonas phthalicica]SMX28221.1 hypothetical protein TRP8649_02336 [Pelagimonas phthalicica]